MVRIKETQKRVKEMLKKVGVAKDSPLDLITGEDGEGIVLDSGFSGGVVKTWYNYEVYGIYPDLTADTNAGLIDLKKEVKDEDDWYTIEDAVKDTIGADDGGNQVFIVLYTMIEADDFQCPIVDTKVFATEAEAEKYLKTDYKRVRKGLKNGDTVLDFVSDDFCGNNAEICLGFGDEVEVKHTWRVYKDTIGYEGD